MRDETITIAVEDDRVTLGGSWLTPPNPVAGALLLPGSGPQDRDETIAGQTPLRDLACALARLDVATLRCDDRGVGESTGDYLAADASTLDADALAQLTWLDQACPDVPLVAIGHSQGAYFAMRLASKAPRLRGVALLGAMIRPGMIGMLDMRRQMGADAGFTGAELEAYVDHSRSLFDVIARVDRADAREDAVRRLVQESVTGAVDADFAPDFESVKAYIDYAVEDSLEWEVRELLRADPSAILASIDLPVLAIWGSLDRHLDPSCECTAFKQACSNGVAHTLDNRNHLFQASKTGRIDDYASDGTPMLAPVPDLLAAWIRTLGRA